MAILIATSVAAALLTLGVLAVVTRRRASAALAVSVERTVFLFDGRDLVDATMSAQAILDGTPVDGADWERLAAFLAPRFPTLGASLAEGGPGELPDLIEGHGLRLRVEHFGGLSRVELVDPGADGPIVLIDAMTRRADQEELAGLRETVASAPLLIWRTDSSDQLVWANRAYIARAALHLGEPEEALAWPLPDLLDPGARPWPAGAQRLCLSSPQKPKQWYDCHSFASDGGGLHFALPADAAVAAEASLREFVQTLTKTFAHLATGLAIFDRQRQLALFNPALIDLTSLSPDFLSARPTLSAFLDRLREGRIIPEPKDYPSWRERMTALEKAASAGQYDETWTLPSGQTYRVVGRPHPDGAVAFLFEDISAEISLTRRFRSELELGQAVIDRLDEAIAVFSPSGDIVLSNQRYADLWGFDPNAVLASIHLRHAASHWQSMTRPTAFWTRAQDAMLSADERDDLSEEVQLLDGRMLWARFRPMPGGATMATFGPRPSAPAEVRVRRTARRRGGAAEEEVPKVVGDAAAG